MELAQPQRIGKVVLCWEVAYGRAYRIETSADGTTWTTAAAVTAGDGGMDTLRFDVPATKFVRMQGVQRGTGYGYSLYELEVYRSCRRRSCHRDGPVVVGRRLTGTGVEAGSTTHPTGTGADGDSGVRQREGADTEA